MFLPRRLLRGELWAYEAGMGEGAGAEPFLGLVETLVAVHRHVCTHLHPAHSLEPGKEF